MRTPRWVGLLIVFLLASIALTVLVIPGVGFESRSLSAFPAWQQPLFMIGGPIVLILHVVALALLAWRARAGGAVATLVGLLVLVLSTVGLLGLGAPPVPTPLLVIEPLHILVGLGTVLLGGAIAGRRFPASLAPS